MAVLGDIIELSLFTREKLSENERLYQWIRE